MGGGVAGVVSMYMLYHIFIENMDSAFFPIKHQNGSNLLNELYKIVVKGFFFFFVCMCTILVLYCQTVKIPK